MSIRPSIVLYHDPAADRTLVDAFTCGLEEEGVPVELTAIAGVAEQLARSAAEQSALFVGAGIDASGTIVLHEQRLGDRSPLRKFTGADPGQARSMGTAAGRLARGRPIPS